MGGGRREGVAVDQRETNVKRLGGAEEQRVRAVTDCDDDEDDDDDNDRQRLQIKREVRLSCIQHALKRKAYWEFVHRHWSKDTSIQGRARLWVNSPPAALHDFVMRVRWPHPRWIIFPRMCSHLGTPRWLSCSSSRRCRSLARPVVDVCVRHDALDGSHLETPRWLYLPMH